MTKTVDFDAFRHEQAAEPLELTIGGKVYQLPSALPATLALDIVRLREEMGDEGNMDPAKLMEFGAGLFGSAETFADVLRDAHVTLAELPDLIRMVIEGYQIAGPTTAPAEKTPAGAKPTSRSSKTGR